MQKYLPIYLLILIGAASRLIPHMPNFAPVGAIALFAGIYLPRKWAFSIPLAAMLASDLLIGTYTPPIMAAVYLGFVITVAIGLLIKNRKSFSIVAGGTLAASLIFYIITNFSVWAFGTMYEHSLNGLMYCYYMALPFFRNSLMGDIFYTALLVGGYEMAMNWSTVKRFAFNKVKIQ